MSRRFDYNAVNYLLIGVDDKSITSLIFDPGKYCRLY